MHQGRCSLPADEAGRVLDRLAGLEEIIRPEDIQQALNATGRVNSRRCMLTHEVVLWVVLAMGLFTELPIRQVFKHARRLRKGEESPHRSSLCVARKRLGVAPVRHLFAQIVRPLAKPTTPGAFYGGYRLMGIDSTVFDVPDTPANDAAFGRPSAGPRGDGAFPQVRKLSVVELGTHVEVAMVVKHIHCGERTMVAALLRHLPAEMLLLLDRGFFSKDRDGVLVRVIRYTLNDPQRVGHEEVHTLITNLVDETLYPAEELIILYHERWEHELVYDEQKTHQDPRRATKPAQLRSETPVGVIQEIYALSLGHFVIRSLMYKAAEAVQLDPDQLSFTGCFQILKCRLPECDSSTPQSFEDWYQALLWEMQNERTDDRRNRINPRVIKRKMSKWPKKRPHHRRPPPMKKSFGETVVMVR